MDISNMKNMIILKNLPSNIVDEAFVVLKSNKKVKYFEKIENTRKINDNLECQDDNQYIVKEAEMLISDYISQIENNDKKYIKGKDGSKIYKIWAYISSTLALLEWIILITS